MGMSVEYAVEDSLEVSHRLRYDDNKQAKSGKLRKSDSNPGIGKGVLYTSKCPDLLYGPEDHCVAVKRPGYDAVIYCPI